MTLTSLTSPLTKDKRSIFIIQKSHQKLYNSEKSVQLHRIHAINLSPSCIVQTSMSFNTVLQMTRPTS